MIRAPKFKVGDLVKTISTQASYKVESIERADGQWWYWGPYGEWLEKDLKKEIRDTGDFKPVE